MLLFFNQEVIKYLDKKNEYLYIFNVKKEKINEVFKFLFQKLKKEVEIRLPFIFIFLNYPTRLSDKFSVTISVELVGLAFNRENGV